jgi:hypothetical protein
MATTAFARSAKSELPNAGHCFSAPVGPLTVTCSSTTAMTAITPSIVNLIVGMKVTGTNAAANTRLAMFVSGTAATIVPASTGALTSATFTGDTFNMLLIKVTPTGTYDSTLANVGTPGTGAPSVTNVGTDETSGAGYTTDGFALTNITPAVNSTGAVWSFSVNPNWTSASFSAVAAVIFNKDAHIGAANGVTANAAGSAINRAISVHDFGGTQTVTSGTFTVNLPANTFGNAILQIS